MSLYQQYHDFYQIVETLRTKSFHGLNEEFQKSQYTFVTLLVMKNRKQIFVQLFPAQNSAMWTGLKITRKNNAYLISV